MAQYQHLLHEIDDGISIVTINRPEKRNCLDQQLWKDIQKALKAADDNPHVQVHMLTGTGSAFCAGDDISLLTHVSDPDVMKDLLLDCIYGLFSAIIFLQKPLITVVNGHAYGGGCEIVLLSDLAVASDKAMFALPEGRIGAWPMVFATFGPFLLGHKAANELTMLGEPVSAQRALSLGLINCVVPHEDLMGKAIEMVGKVSRSSPMSLKIIKETTARILGERLYDFWISQLRSLKESSRTHDWLEGANAFLEKRPPRFKGH